MALTALAPLQAPCAELHLFAGAGLRHPVDRLVEEFQKKAGHKVVSDYDGSGRLLAKISASGSGDLFMPGSLFYIEKLMKEGKIASFKPIVAHTPVIAVNRKKADLIKGFSDLAKPGIRLAFGDPKAMALGKTTVTILDRSSLKEKIMSNAVVYGATVKQLAIYAAQGEADATIIGRADAFQFKDKLIMLPIPKEYFEDETVAVAVLTSTRNPAEAELLQNFLSSPEAIETFKSFGFLPLE